MKKIAPPSLPESPADFFRRIGDASVFADMFEVLPRIYLFIKSKEHRYVRVNRGLAALHGCADSSSMVGKTDFDFNPPTLAAQYVEEDRRVMKSRRPLIDQVWLVQSADGMPRWYLSSKFPLIDGAGDVIGLAGVMRPYDQAGDSPGEYQRLTAVCEYVLAHYSEAISVSDLAARAHLSVSQLQREFRRLFGMSPSDYLLRVRLLMGRRKLEETLFPAGRIALECGFYDQSHFTRAFRAATGLSPLAYRRRFAPGQIVSLPR